MSTSTSTSTGTGTGTGTGAGTGTRTHTRTSTGIEYSTVPKTDNYDSISEEDMIVESPVGFFFDMEHDDKSFSDNISKSSIETNDLSINTMA